MSEQTIELSTPTEKRFEAPVVSKINDLESIIQAENMDNLFLRWTYDIDGDMQPDAFSRNLMHGTAEAGISADPINPYPERGYGLNENYRYARHYKQDPNLPSQVERKYYLLKGNQLRDENGKLKIGDNAEPLLDPKSIVALAEVSPDAIEEAYFRKLALEAIGGFISLKNPGDLMIKIRDVLASWNLERESAEVLRKRTLEGVDKYLENKTRSKSSLTAIIRQ